MQTSTPEHLTCYHCHTLLNEITTETKINRGDECPKCKVGLRCCRMCLHYDKQIYNECRESNAERILDKERVNYCDYFTTTNKDKNSLNQADELAKKAMALFKD